MQAILGGHVVLEHTVLEHGVVLVDEGKIKAVGIDLPVPAHASIIDATGYYVGPGFVDIHCHAGGDCWAYEDPAKMAQFHLEGGTTSLNCTIYHDIGEEGAALAMQKIRAAMQAHTPGNIMGVHFEGPFFNPKYGAKAKTIRPVDKREYMRHIAEAGDILRMWTVAPEIENARAFINDVHAAGITLAMGHSEASPADVFWAAAHGVTVCTHLMDATGSSIAPSRWGGTRECGFDEAVMLCDRVYCELINDSEGVHVRPEMIRLVIKTVGIDYVVGVTDACTGAPEDGKDINMENGELCGSKMRMFQVARNFKNNAHLSMVDVFKVCARNPARAMHMEDIGVIAPGKKANFVIVDDDYALQKVVLEGALVHAAKES